MAKRRRKSASRTSERFTRALGVGRGAAWAVAGWTRANIRHVWRLWPVVLLALLATVCRQQMQHSPSFRLEEIRISECRQVTGVELRRHLHSRCGQNIFSVDLKEEARRIVSHPWVGGAVVTRVLPRALEIEIDERRPVALLKVRHLYLLDEQGVVFKRLEKGDPADLPIITGFSAESFHAGGAVARRQAKRIAEAVELISTAQRLGVLAEADVSEVGYDLVSGFSLVTAETGLTVRIGYGEFERKLKDFGVVVRKLDTQLAKARVVDLVVPGRVVVRGLPKGSGV